MHSYWDDRFSKEGYVWGISPSQTAEYALAFFRKHNVKSILVPGAGYGRNTRFFSSAGLAVTGVEISEVACGMTREFDPQTVFHHGSALDMSFSPDLFDAIYCFNTLHLFLEKNREQFLKECARKLKANGLLFFTVFSEKEENFGKGKEVEKNTFESRPGRPAHYFTEEDMRAHFKDFSVLESGVFLDSEEHGEGPHTHILRYIAARKC
ncbi:MAG: hypothetical protein A2Z03_04600 [Chloroflexi bacterium RBG_16_56_8]|nr:MAG: hypothetical protein A2Z03_04600 [Chloroflexi bacterium RBG_16_56_8]